MNTNFPFVIKVDSYIYYLLHNWFMSRPRPRPHYAGGIWKRRFHSETRQMFFVHSTPEELKNATITGHFGFVFEENSIREITWLPWLHRFRKGQFSKCFSSTRKRKAVVLKFPRFEEHFRPFSWLVSVDDRPNRRNKAVFSNLSGAVWTLANASNEYSETQ